MNIFFSLTKTYLTTNNQEYQEHTFRVSVRYDIEEPKRMDGHQFCFRFLSCSRT